MAKLATVVLVVLLSLVAQGVTGYRMLLQDALTQRCFDAFNTAASGQDPTAYFGAQLPSCNKLRENPTSTGPLVTGCCNEAKGVLGSGAFAGCLCSQVVFDVVTSTLGANAGQVQEAVKACPGLPSVLSPAGCPAPTAG